MAFAVASAKPVPPVFSPEKAGELHIGSLGFFELWASAPAEGRCSFETAGDGVAPRPTERHDDGAPGGPASGDMSDIDAFHAAITARDHGFERPGVDPARRGGRVMEAADPFMNRLRFWEP